MVKRRKVSDKLKLNSKLRVILIILGILLISIGSGGLYKSVTTKEVVIEDKEVYKYTNKFISNYDVNIKTNPYIDGNKMPAGLNYISDLVTSIDMSLNYSYTDLQEEAVPVKYDYKIDAIIKATYETDDKEYEVLSKTENLKRVEVQETTSDNLVINESINIPYSKYHEIIKDFKQTLGMNVDAKLYIILTVNTTADVNSKQVKNEYKSDYKINLGNKVATVDAKNNDTNSNSIRNKTTTEKKVDFDTKKAVCSIIAMIAGIAITYLIACKTTKLNIIENKYKEELNRILKSCQDRIVIVENQLDMDIDNTILVAKFEELIKLSEELYKPILCWTEKNVEETQFSVISNRVRYVYILK